MRSRFEQLIAFLRARFSSEGLFSLHLTIGSVALIGSAWLFGGVAEDLITNDPLTFVDVLVSEWFRINATPSFTAKMRLASSLASTIAVLSLSIVVSTFLLWKRRWYGLLALALVVPGGLLGVFVVFAVKSWWWRAIAIALAFMIIGAVGFSRIYLGAHYVSDVIAAFAAEAAWLAICLTAVETLRRHRHPSSSTSTAAGETA